jgi:hypothetical protein
LRERAKSDRDKGDDFGKREHNAERVQVKNECESANTKKGERTAQRTDEDLFVLM